MPHPVGGAMGVICHDIEGHPPGHIFFGTYMYFRLSLWMAMHLCMRRATPSVYLNLCEGLVDDCSWKKSGDF